GGGRLGGQVIALGNGALHAVLLPGGLPGAGWDGENKILLAGQVDGEKAALQPAEGNRKYLAGPAAEFSATSQFPPPGHKPYSAELTLGRLAGKTDDGKSFELKRVERRSETLGAAPPEGALVLFDGSEGSMEHWNRGRLDEKTKLLNTD